MDAFDEVTKEKIVQEYKRKTENAKMVNEQLREAKLRAIDHFH